MTYKLKNPAQDKNAEKNNPGVGFSLYIHEVNKMFHQQHKQKHDKPNHRWKPEIKDAYQNHCCQTRDADAPKVWETKVRRRNNWDKSQNRPENKRNADPVNEFIGVVLMAFAVFFEQLINLSHIGNIII